MHLQSYNAQYRCNVAMHTELHRPQLKWMEGLQGLLTKDAQESLATTALTHMHLLGKVTGPDNTFAASNIDKYLR